MALKEIQSHPQIISCSGQDMRRPVESVVCDSMCESQLSDLSREAVLTITRCFLCFSCQFGPFSMFLLWRESFSNKKISVMRILTVPRYICIVIYHSLWRCFLLHTLSYFPYPDGIVLFLWWRQPADSDGSSYINHYTPVLLGGGGLTGKSWKRWKTIKQTKTQTDVVEGDWQSFIETV